jgi:hypothetical protein
MQNAHQNNMGSSLDKRKILPLELYFQAARQGW